MFIKLLKVCKYLFEVHAIFGRSLELTVHHTQVWYKKQLESWKSVKSVVESEI